jgi:Uma2 family endonuclease
MFLKDFEERAGWRLAYDGGRLEIMPPTPEHEEYSFSFQLFVVAYCDAFDLDFEGRGSTTFRRRFSEKASNRTSVFMFKSRKNCGQTTSD